METPRLRFAFDALRRFNAAALPRRALPLHWNGVSLPPPGSGQGIVAGQINSLEVVRRGLRTQFAGRLPMSALGQKRTSARLRIMSALPPKADIARPIGDVRFVPQAGIGYTA